MNRFSNGVPLNSRVRSDNHQPLRLFHSVSVSIEVNLPHGCNYSLTARPGCRYSAVPTKDWRATLRLAVQRDLQSSIRVPEGLDKESLLFIRSSVGASNQLLGGGPAIDALGKQLLCLYGVA